MENNASISTCSVRILLDLGNWTPSIPFPFENPDGRNHVNIAKGHEVFLRCHVYTVLYRNRKRFFKPSETPLFPTIFVGLTGFELATFCFRGVFLVELNGFLLNLTSLENGGFQLLVVFVEPTAIGSP